MNLKHRRVKIGSIAAVVIGSMLWAAVGPAIALIGISTPRDSEDNEWAFFQAYSWLSYPPSTEEKPSTISSIESKAFSNLYWLGFAISIIGFYVLAAGVIGIVLATVREMRAQA